MMKFSVIAGAGEDAEEVAHFLHIADAKRFVEHHRRYGIPFEILELEEPPEETEAEQAGEAEGGADDTPAAGDVTSSSEAGVTDQPEEK
jgi:hypothetical protein